MNRSCFLSFAAWRTPASPWDTRSPPWVGRVRFCLVFSSVHALPSPPSAGGPPSPPLFGWFPGTMAQSDFSTSFMPTLQQFAFSGRSAPLAGTGNVEISRFSCMKFLSVRGVSDYAGSLARSR